jgi:hypothetical protein
MKLEFLMSVEAHLRTGQSVGRGPYGNRQIFDVSGGSFEGPRLKGKILPSGADWLLIGDDGIGRLDVRASLETEDGAIIYTYYPGVLEMNDLVQKAMAGEREPEFGDGYFVTQPRYETGDERYAWLNSVIAIAEGKVGVSRVAYRVYKAVPGE